MYGNSREATGAEGHPSEGGEDSTEHAPRPDQDPPRRGGRPRQRAAGALRGEPEASPKGPRHHLDLP